MSTASLISPDAVNRSQGMMRFAVRPSLTAWTIMTLSFAIVGPLSSSGQPAFVQPVAYEIDAQFVPAEGRINASARVTLGKADESAFHRSDTLKFYLHDELAVESIKVDGEKVAFETQVVPYIYNYTTKALEVTAKLDPATVAPRTIEVSYEGRFTASNARARSDYMRIDSDGVYLRAYGYSLWFPIFLESAKQTHDVAFPRVTIRTPAEFVPVFVGTRVGEDVNGNKRVSNWRADRVDLMAVQLTARRLNVADGGEIFVYHLKDDRSKAAGQAIRLYVERTSGLFSRNFKATGGFSQIHVLQMPEFGDISSGNVVGMAEAEWVDFENAIYPKRVLAHEFVHPFVNIEVAESDPAYALVVEGFPVYFYMPVLAELDGENVYEGWIQRNESSYLQKRETGKTNSGSPLPPEKAIFDLKPEDIGVYKDLFVLTDRVPLFFDFLRRRGGPEKLFAFARAMFANTSITADRFEKLALDYFDVTRDELNTWLRTTDFPDEFRRSAARN